MTRSEQTRRFWNAAFYFRRAQLRDQTLPVKVLEQITNTATGTVQSRAATMLREINGTDQHAPRAG